MALTYLREKGYDYSQKLSQILVLNVGNCKPASYSDWSPTLSSVPHGTRVIAAISASNFVSKPCTRVINAFVITAENSSCTVVGSHKNEEKNCYDKWFICETVFTCTSDISTASDNWESIILDTFSANSPDCQKK